MTRRGACGLLAAALLCGCTPALRAQPEDQMTFPAVLDDVLPILGHAPEFEGLGPWHNSEPLTLAELEGTVVVVDFWTYGCFNCINALPHVQALWEKYRDRGFVVVGVHSPEFAYEKPPENVAKAITQRGLTYPVAQDNDFATWRAYGNRYWPALYLLDKRGNLRFVHYGEGAYAETDRAVQSLLAE